MAVTDLEIEEQSLRNSQQERYSTGIQNLNVTRIWDYFLHGNVQAAMERREGLDALDQRAIITAGSDENVVVRRQDWDRDLVKYLNSIKPNGLGAQPQNIFAVGREKYQSLAEILLENDEISKEIITQKNGEGAIQTYHNSNIAKKLADKWDVKYLGSNEEVADQFGNKVRFRRLTHEIFQNMHDYSSVKKSEGKEQIIDKLKKFTEEFGSIFIRGTKGAGGRSTYSYEGEKDLDELVEAMLTDTGSEEFLIEPHLNSGYSRIVHNPSILYRIVDDEAHLISPVSGQILIDNGHIGNFYPSGLEDRKEEGIKNMTRTMIEEERKRGYVGEGSIDFSILNQGWIVPTENNTRVTGASPIAHLNEELTDRFNQQPYILMFNFDAGYQDFTGLADELEEPDSLLFTGQEKEGVLPIMARYDGHVITSVFSPNPERTTELARETTKRLGIEELDSVLDDQIPWYNE